MSGVGAAPPGNQPIPPAPNPPVNPPVPPVNLPAPNPNAQNAPQLVDLMTALNNHGLGSGGYPLECPRNYTFGEIHRFEEFLDDNDADLDEVILFSSYVAIDTLLHSTNPIGAGPSIETLTAVVAGEDAAVTATRNEAIERNEESEKIIDKIAVCLPKARRWVFELIACMKVADLTILNVENYFRMIDGAMPNRGEYLKMLKWAKPMFPEIVADQNLYNQLNMSKFLEYHTTFSSTAGLLNRVLESLPENAKIIFTADELAAVNRSVANPWDKDANDAITERAKVIAMVFYQVNNINIGRWYQGEKAISSASVTFINSTREFFIALNRVAKDSSKLRKAKDVDEVLANIPETLAVRAPVIDYNVIVLEKKAERHASRVRKANRIAKRKYLREHDNLEGYVPLRVDDIDTDSEED